MNRPNLSQIYRSSMQSTSDPAADVDQLIAQIPRSPLQRDLIRFARELEPASAQLSASLESVFRSDVVVHRNRFATQHSARGRRWRIASALAASVIAAVAVWSGSNLNRPHPAAPVANAGDRIFSSLNEDSVATRSATSGDKIFTGDFRTDEIFSSTRHNNG